ncbi:unnamed protein product [Durusdinium trenchii]|uniref:Uncharacterized protein n=1 Tax=Durusdinium trenchii TaxID=1381693 RepID=A0ABP0KAM2_9DINO
MSNMEIRIDAVEGQATPKDTFVSMRIGDYQKQSRFGSAKTYRFPQIEDQHRFARIEVFHRIGHLTVNLDNIANQAVEVPVEHPEVKLLPMKLAVVSDTVEAKTEQKEKQQKVKNKVDAAQKYLAEHHVEEVIADAIREVIHEMPSDPHSFLAALILKQAANKQEELLVSNDGKVIVSDFVDQSAPKLVKPPTVKAAIPQEPQLLPFREYYASHVRSLAPSDLENLYAKFPGQPKPVAKPAAESSQASVPFAMRPSVGTWLNKAPMKEALPVSKPAAESSQASVPFAMRPSVGTWLNKAPKKGSVEPVSTSKPSPSIDAPFRDYYAAHVHSPPDLQTLYAKFPAPSPPKVPQKPTESQAKPMKEIPVSQAPEMLPFREYYASHVRSLAPSDLENLYAKFPGQPKPVAKPAAESSQASVPFAMRPSVGTWLNKAPKKGSAEPVSTSKPSPSIDAPFRDYYAAHVHSPPDLQALYKKFPAAPKPASTSPVPVPASVPVPPTMFQHKPSVATWLSPVIPKANAAAAPSILERSRSRIVAMGKEELVEAVVKEIKQKEEAFVCEIKKKEQEFASELHKKDEEIARLKALLQK